MAFILYRVCFSFTLGCQVMLFLLPVVALVQAFRWHAAHPVAWLLFSWALPFAGVLVAYAVFALLTVVLRNYCLRRLH
jgi:hypothetical protein